MAGYEQQDAHEFLVALLDGLETHLHAYHTPSVAAPRSKSIVAISPHPHKKSAEYAAIDLVKKVMLYSLFICLFVLCSFKYKFISIVG
jgi:hypothetical protein